MKIMYPVTSRYDGSIMFEAEIECDKDASTSIKLGLAIQWGVKNIKSMAGAYMVRANMAGADMAGANMVGANMVGANMVGANMAGANMAGANMAWADMAGANMAGANIVGANMAGANMAGAENAEYAIAQTNILPDGDIIGWKKCRDNVIVKLLIPHRAKRSNANGRKCRAEYVNVLEVIGSEVGVSQHEGKTEYVAGQVVKCSEPFDENRFNECASGIHFFITRIEAERY